MLPLKQKISCQSRKDTFNPEIEQQWRQNQNEISEEEFVHTLNFLCDLQKPARTKLSDDNLGPLDVNYKDLTHVEDFIGDGDEPEDEFEDLPQVDDDQLYHLSKRKHVSLCRHKLQNKPTANPEAGGQPPTNNPRLQNSRKRTPIMNGLS